MNPGKRLYYFAFGSNILQERIEDRLGNVRKVSTYTLPDWKMVFNCGNKFQSFANLIESEGSSTEGVLYNLTDYQVSKLDMYEGYPVNYQKKYFVTPDYILFAYVCFNPHFKTEVLPNLRYINIILDGCKQQNLIRTYNELVNFKNDNFKKIKGNKHKLIEL